VLSRKPTPKTVQRIDPVTGLVRMSLEDDEEEVVQTIQPTPEELRLKAQREREEKQKRYDEVRARIMGPPSGSGGSSPGAVTPPIVGEGSKSNWGRGRGKDSRQQDSPRPASRSGVKELYDPEYTSRQSSSIPKRNGGSRSGRSTPRDEDNLIRSPRGPDESGRGGFASRGKKG
jgi:hypothetical protein